MKFKLHDIKKIRGRLGCIQDVERLPAFKLETPNLLFFTKGGCIPHLTHEVMQLLTSENVPLQFSLDSMYPIIPALEQSGMALHSFVGLPEYFSYCVVQNPIRGGRRQHLKTGFATLWTNSGNVIMDKTSYMENMELCKPDMYVSLYDGETDLTSRCRRLRNSTTETGEMFKYCFEKHQSSPVLKNKGFIAPLVGGYDLSLREECAKFMADFPVTGYLIDGLYTNCETVPTISHESVENVLSHTLPFLPEERVRIIHGPWEPELVLKMVKLGVDLFDTTFPQHAADNGCALVFDYNVDNLFDNNIQLYNHSLYSKCVENTEIIADSIPAVEKQGDCLEKVEETSYKNPYTVSLRDKKYFDDFSPLFEGCDCLTCRKHTKAYVHHLLSTKELLASVLLTLHNLHHYMKFFQRIRDHLRRTSQETTGS